MTYFAKINDGIVVQVIAATQEFVDTQTDTFIETSYDGSFRKNYAGLGFTWDEERDAFIQPQPYPSWILNENTCLWESPIPIPDDFYEVDYEWNEETVSWIT